MRGFFLFLLFVFFVGCGNSGSVVSDKNITYGNIKEDDNPRVYGKSLKNKITVKTIGESTIYYPSTANKNSKTPVILFAPGFGSYDHNNYKTLLTFIAEQGYSVIYTKDKRDYRPQILVEQYESVLNDKDISVFLDKSKFGVIGHSAGGGNCFKISQIYYKKGYGSEKRFIFAMASWYAFLMTPEDFKTIPQDTALIMVEFGQDMSTDPRIPLTIYKNCSHIRADLRDYQVVADGGHGYPARGTYASMQGILKPLDALMDYIFRSNKNAKSIALDIGSDTPYESGLQKVLPSKSYQFPCKPNSKTLDEKAIIPYKINYCSIVP